jgi:lipoprotein signal peptidase
LSKRPNPQPTQPEASPTSTAAPARSAPDTADPGARATALRHFPSYLRFIGVAVIGLALDLWSKHWAFHTLGQGHKPVVIIPHVLELQTMLNKGALFGIGGGQTLLFLIASVCALLLVFWMFSQTSPRRRALQIALGGVLAGALGNMYDRARVQLVDHAFPYAGRALYTVRTGEDEHGIILEEYPPHDDGVQYRMRMSGNPEGGVVVQQYPRGVAFPLDAIPAEVGFVRDFLKIPTKIWRDQDLWPWVFNVADVLLVGGVAILAIHLWRDRRRRPKKGRMAVDSRRLTT